LIVDVDVKGALEEGEQFLLNRGDALFASIEFIGWPPREKLLADVYQLVRFRVLKRQPVAYGEHFTVDKKKTSSPFSLRIATSTSERFFFIM
jgi:hypothetical protein